MQEGEGMAAVTCGSYSPLFLCPSPQQWGEIFAQGLKHGKGRWCWWWGVSKKRVGMSLKSSAYYYYWYYYYYCCCYRCYCCCHCYYYTVCTTATSVVPSCRLQAMQGNSDCRKASSLISKSLKDTRLASRNCLLWIICAKAAAAILLLQETVQGVDVLSDQGGRKGGTALLPPQISHKCCSGSGDGSRQAWGAEQIPRPKGLSHVQEDQERLWSLFPAPQALWWLLGDFFTAPWRARSNLDTCPELPAKEASTSFFSSLSFHYLHRVCMEICLPVQAAWKLPFSQPLAFTILYRCLSGKQNRTTMYSSNYSFSWHREIHCVRLFLVQRWTYWKKHG